MTQALKLVLLAAYLTTAYGAALPKSSSTGEQQSTSTDGSSSEYGSGPTGTSTRDHPGRPTDGPTGGSLKNGVKGPVFDETFPNPSLIKVKDTWYSFATSHNGKNIQMAKSTDFENWTYLNKDALPNASAAKWVATEANDYGSSSSSMGYSMSKSSSSSMGYSMSKSSSTTEGYGKPHQTGGPSSGSLPYEKRAFGFQSEDGAEGSYTKSNKPTKTQSTEGTQTTNPPKYTQSQGPDSGAQLPKFRKPDVIETPEGKFVMQFTSRHKSSVHRCIVVAKADQVEGPYVPEAEPFYCEEDLQGGDFDSSFYQEGKELYMVFNKRSHQIDPDTPDSPTSSNGGTYPTSSMEEYPTATDSYPGSSETGTQSTGLDGPSTFERRAYPISETTSESSSSKPTDGPSGYPHHSQSSSQHSKHPTGTATATGPKGPQQSQGGGLHKYRESCLTLMSVSTDGENWGMKPDNATKPVELLRSNESDRPGVSAPFLTKQNGIYFLTFSTNQYDTAAYDIEYATAKDLKGPYQRASAPLLKQGDAPQINGPGGASFSRDGKYMVFQNRDQKGASSSSSAGPEPYPTGSSSSSSSSRSHSTSATASIETYPTIPYPAYTARPNSHEKRAAHGEQSSSDIIAEPTGKPLLGPIVDPIRPQPDNSMIRHLWVGEVEYHGATMNVVGMKEGHNGGNGPSATQTYGGSSATETASTKKHSTTGQPQPTYV